jgi:sec-independent protein translocase protein TatA
MTAPLHTLFLMGMPNGPELIVTLLILAVLFGGKKIPELAKGLGQGMREFNNAKNGIDDQHKEKTTDRTDASQKNIAE